MIDERVRPMSFSLYPSTKERLAKFKENQKGNISFDEAINKLIDIAEKKVEQKND